MLSNWSGPLTSNTTFVNTEVQNIVGNVDVKPGVTLTVQAGTVVQFSGGTSLTVDGTLLAEGTASKTIIFTSVNDNSASGGSNKANPGDWGQLLFTSTSTGSMIDYAVIKYGGGAEVEASGASPTIENSTIAYSTVFGVQLVDSDATLTGDMFQNNGFSYEFGGAIHIDLASQPVISGITYTNNNLFNGVALDGGSLPAGTTTWSNPGVVFWLDGDLTVPTGSTLVLGPGQIIKLGGFNSGNNVIVKGTLEANGTAAQPVVLTSKQDDSVGGDTNNDGSKSSPQRGDWNGIQFTSTSTNSVLDHVLVDYGGNPEVQASGSSPTIENTTFANASVLGVQLVGSDATLTADTFLNDGFGYEFGGAMSMDMASQPVMSGITFTNNNQYNGVSLAGGNLPTGTTTWNNPGVVYWLSADVTVPAGSTLVIDPGQIIKLGGYGSGNNLIVQGTLQASGTAAAPVVFTSKQDDSEGGDTNNDGSKSSPQPGDWGDIQFTATSTASMLDNVVVNYGGTNEVEADGSSPTIENSTIANAAGGVGNGYGLQLQGSDAVVTGDTFLKDGFGADGGGAFDMDQASLPVISGDTFTANFINGVSLEGGSLPGGTTTWNFPGVVLWLNANVTVPASSTLVIDPGLVLKFGGLFGSTQLVVQGSLQAQGTAAQPIIFTSKQDQSAGGNTNNAGSTASPPGPGDWNGIQFTSTSTANVMNHVEVRYGGQVGIDNLGAIEVDGVGLSLTNSVVRDSVHAAVDIRAGSSVTLATNLLVDNTGGTGFEAQAGSTVTAVNNTIDHSLIGAIINSESVTLTNNLITNSSNSGIQVNNVSTLSAAYNDVYNPSASQGNYFGITAPTGTDGNISADPQYFNAADLQYELIPGSPAEGAGTSLVSPGVPAPATDFLGNPPFKDPNITGRGDGSGYDIGAIWPQQVATSNVDLATTAVSGPATGIEGQSVTVNWTVESVGAGTAVGSWHDAVYLSASPVFTPDAILLGEVQHTGDLGPGQSYNASGTFTLPGVVPGNDYFLVRCNSFNEVFEGSALANNVMASAMPVAMSLPALTLGTPLAGGLAATGSSELYQVTTTATGDLDFTLTGPSGATNELYVSFGNVPTTQSFDARGIRPGSANQSVSLASAQAGTYYVLVYGASVPSAESFTLTASTAGFSLTSVSPTQGSNTGQVTLSIYGAQFDDNSQPQLVDSAGVTIKPLAVYYTDSGLISATFDLTGLPTGAAGVQVVNTGGATETLPAGFKIIAGSPGQLVTNLSAPSSVRLGRDFTITVQYANDGDTDLLAPVMHLSGLGFSELSFTPDMSNPATSLDLVGVNSTGPAGILPPGSQGSVTIYGEATSTGQDDFHLSIGEYPAVPIDWSAIKPLIQPLDSNLSDAEWDALFAQLQTDIGPTWNDYQQAVSTDATLFPAAMGANDSLENLLQLNVDQAFDKLYPGVSGELSLGDATDPLGGATVRLYDQAGVLEELDTVSLNDGSFDIPFVPAGTYTVAVDGYVVGGTGSVTVGATGMTGLQLSVTPGATIEGGVVQTAGGAPATDEPVYAVSDTGDSFSATTDLNGQYALTGLPAGTYQVSAGGDSFVEAVNTGVVVAAGGVVENCDLALAPGGTISGTVTGPGGPVAGALVGAAGADGVTSATATTAADGAYTITGLPAEAYSVSATADGLFGTPDAGVNVTTAGSTGGVDLTMAQGGSLSGQLQSSVDGSPAADVDLSLQNGATTESAETDASGDFSVTDLPPGVYTITTVSTDFMTATATATVAAGATASVTITVGPIGQVSGTVTSSAGLAVAGVTVSATGGANFETSAVTDSSGAYMLTGLDAGTYQVTVGDEGTPGLVGTQVTLNPTNTAVTANLSLDVAGTISGTVFEANGSTPLSGAEVELSQAGVGLLGSTSDDQGNYSFVIVAPGTYQVEALAQGLAYPPLTGLVVTGGAALTGQDFQPGAQQVDGVVTDAATGQPIAGATVNVIASATGLTLTDLGQATTGSDGSFQVTGLVAGAYEVTASAAGYAFATQSVTVTAGVPASVQFSLGLQSTLDGTILDSAGVAVAGATVTLASATFTAAAQTDASGAYSIAGMAPGSYTLDVQAAGYATAILSGVNLTTGANLRNVSLGNATIEVNGTAGDAAGALGQVDVSAFDAQGNLAADALTAQDGTFSLTTLAPGTYVLIASAPGFQPSAPVTLMVTAGQTMNSVSLAISPVAVEDPQGGGVTPATAAPSAPVLSPLLTQPAPNAQAVAFATAVQQYPCTNALIATEIAALYAHQQAALATWQSDWALVNSLGLAQDPAQLKGNFAADLAKFNEDWTSVTSGAAFGNLAFSGSESLMTPERLLGLLLVVRSAEFALETATKPEFTDSTTAQDCLLAGTMVLDDLAAFEVLLQSFQSELLNGPATPLSGYITSLVDKVLPEADQLRQDQIALNKVWAASVLLAQDQQDYQNAAQAFLTQGGALYKTCMSCDASSYPAPQPQIVAPMVAMTGQVCRKPPETNGDFGGSFPPPSTTSVGPTPPSDAPVNLNGPSAPVKVGGPIDPNNLVGPAGFGPQGFIQPGTMPYEVDFENDPTKATAAAQVVTATMTLDPNLDPSTFQFTGFGFGAYNFTVPAGLSDYSTTIDLRPDGIDLLVPVTLDLNQATGVVTVTFQSLDPATMEPPEGINAGFLPVDDAEHDGEGYFTYTVQPKAGLLTGTTISAQASIVFDTNAAIATPTTLNTLDVGPPTSSVTALPATEKSPAFTVSWSGSDDTGGSGIAFYDVFVSDNGGPYLPFLTATTATSAPFQGVAGHTYAFYSVATDNVGNRQATPTSVQATTSVDGQPTSTVKSLPATTTSTSFTVSWSGSPGPGATSITSYEIFVSDDGGAFTPFLTKTSATSATFTGQPGNTYRFYSVATNNLGITQPAPTTAQATTTVSSPPVPPLIIGEKAVFSRKTNKKGKPVGKAVLTGFSLTFNAALNSGAAMIPGNYQLDNVTTKKVKKKVTTILKPITKFTISYVSATDTVDLNLIGTQAFATGGQLTVESGVTGATGAPVGGTTVFAISKKGNTITPSAS